MNMLRVKLYLMVFNTRHNEEQFEKCSDDYASIFRCFLININHEEKSQKCVSIMKGNLMFMSLHSMSKATQFSTH